MKNIKTTANAMTNSKKACEILAIDEVVSRQRTAYIQFHRSLKCNYEAGIALLS
jgi:hypothetical protein